MASPEQVAAVKAYLRQQFADGDVSTPSVDHGVRFRVGNTVKSYDLQFDTIFETLGADSLSRWLDSHYIAQRMHACGPGSVVSLHGLSKEPVCMRDPAVVEQDKALLSRIRHHIGSAGETLSSEKLNERAAMYFFEIGRDRLVEVDRSFLDADDGLDVTLGRLDGWDLRDLLATMRPGDTLVITKDGPPAITRS
jgi:hypothetical protein